jgi:hypothetical protein
MIKPELEFVYEATGELEPPRPIGETYDGTRRIIPIIGGGRVEGPLIKGRLIGNAADWQLTRTDGVTVADAIYAIETDDGAVIQIRNKACATARQKSCNGWPRASGRSGGILFPHRARIHRAKGAV